MKSRGCYETPGGTILLRAHRAIESLTLDREVAHLKDDLMPRYASMVYNGYWWSPEREALQALIDHTQQRVNGTVTVKLFKGNVIIVGRSSADSLFDAKIVTFEEDEGAYNQADAGGFIKLNALAHAHRRGQGAGRPRAQAGRAESRPQAEGLSSGPGCAPAPAGARRQGRILAPTRTRCPSSPSAARTWLTATSRCSTASTSPSSRANASR